jgi:hypothetical protein
MLAHELAGATPPPPPPTDPSMPPPPPTLPPAAAEAKAALGEVQAMVKDIRGIRDRAWAYFGFEPGPTGKGAYRDPDGRPPSLLGGEEPAEGGKGTKKGGGGKGGGRREKEKEGAGGKGSKHRVWTRGAALRMEGRSKSLMDVPGVAAADDLANHRVVARVAGGVSHEAAAIARGGLDCAAFTMQVLEAFWQGGGMRVTYLAPTEYEHLAPVMLTPPPPKPGSRCVFCFVGMWVGFDMVGMWKTKRTKTDAHAERVSQPPQNPTHHTNTTSNPSRLPPLPHDAFTPAETRLLIRGLVLAGGEGQWPAIHRISLGGRPPEEIRWYSSTQTAPEIVKWKTSAVSALKTAFQRAPLAGAPPPFTPEEDALLWTGHHTAGPRWVHIARAFLPNRLPHDLLMRWRRVQHMAPPTPALLEKAYAERKAQAPKAHLPVVNPKRGGVNGGGGGGGGDGGGRQASSSAGGGGGGGREVRGAWCGRLREGAGGMWIVIDCVLTLIALDLP